MKLSTVIITVSFVMLVYSFWHRNDLPASVEALPALREAPRQTRANANEAQINRHRMAWLAIIVGLAVSGVTVHLWNAVFAYFFFLIGTGAWMAYPERSASPRRLAALLALNTSAPRARAAN